MPKSPPASVNVFAHGLCGLAALFGALWWLRGTTLFPEHQALVCMAAVALPQVALLVLGGRTLLTAPPVRPLDAGRVLRKLVGLAATIMVLAVAYWALPEYQKNMYHPFFNVVEALLPWLAAAAPVYVAFVDRRMAEPEDAYAALGGLVLGRGARPGPGVLGQHALGWLVKGFFLPLMFVYLSRQVMPLAAAPTLLPADASAAYDIAWGLVFLVDLGFVTVGYVLTLRLLGTEIRSTDPTMLGWVVALAVYYPFWDTVRDAFFAYDDDLYWGGLLRGEPLLYAGWGGLIIAFMTVHALTTVSFGLRFSNLTHRGIITDGPFRFTKHPHYITKNLSWWMISLPFIAATPGQAVQNSLLLLGVNFIYFMRAWTEERHLSRDPDYVAYALWIEEHGLFRGLGRLLPALRYSRMHAAALPPRATAAGDALPQPAPAE